MTEKKELQIWLVRHGEKVEHEHQSDMLPPLTERGREQALRLAERLRGMSFDVCYTSDMVRALQTAEPVLAGLPDVPHRVDPRLREVDFFHTRRGFVPTEEGVVRQMRDEQARAAEFAEWLVQHHRDGEKLLLICHGNIIRLLSALWNGTDPQMAVPFLTDCTSVTILRYNPERFEFWNAPVFFDLVNCTRHLQG